MALARYFQVNYVLDSFYKETSVQATAWLLMAQLKNTLLAQLVTQHLQLQVMSEVLVALHKNR